jgi:hypothetical protein
MIDASTRLAGRSGGRGSAGVLPCKHGGLAAAIQFVEAALRIARTGAVARPPPELEFGRQQLAGRGEILRPCLEMTDHKDSQTECCPCSGAPPR